MLEKEPRSFRVARCLVVSILALIWIAIAVLNFIRYQTSPKIIQQSTVADSLFPVTPLINVYARSGESVSVACRRVTKGSPTEDGGNGFNYEDIPLLKNAIHGKDFTEDTFVDPPLVPYMAYIPFLNSSAMASPLKSFFKQNESSQSSSYDLFVTCEVNITTAQTLNRTARSLTMAGRGSAVLAGILFETNPVSSSLPLLSVNETRVPRFSALDDQIKMLDQQEVNVVLSIGKFCEMDKPCQFTRSVRMTQSTPLSQPVNTIQQQQSVRRAVVTYSIRNPPATLNTSQGLYNVRSFEENRSYTLLEVFASIFSSFSVLLLIYTFLMGESRMDPLGCIRRWFLHKDTERYVERVELAGKCRAKSLGKDIEVGAMQSVMTAFYVKPLTKRWTLSKQMWGGGGLGKSSKKQLRHISIASKCGGKYGQKGWSMDIASKPIDSSDRIPGFSLRKVRHASEACVYDLEEGMSELPAAISGQNNPPSSYSNSPSPTLALPQSASLSRGFYVLPGSRH